MNSLELMEETEMEGKNLFGVPIIDELRLCYVAEPSLLKELAGIPIGHSAVFYGYIFVRIGGDRFEYTFVVFVDDTEDRIEIGKIKFGRYGNGSCNQVFFRANNPILYDRAKMEIAAILGIPSGTIKYHLSSGRSHLKELISL